MLIERQKKIRTHMTKLIVAFKNFPKASEKNTECGKGTNTGHHPVAITVDDTTKLSRYRPEQAHGKPGRLRPRIFLTFGHYEGGKVVTITHRPALLPGVFLVLIFRS